MQVNMNKCTLYQHIKNTKCAGRFWVCVYYKHFIYELKAINVNDYDSLLIVDT